MSSSRSKSSLIINASKILRNTRWNAPGRKMALSFSTTQSPERNRWRREELGQVPRSEQNRRTDPSTRFALLGCGAPRRSRGLEAESRSRKLTKVPVGAGSFRWLPTVSFVLRTVRSERWCPRTNLKHSLREVVHNLFSWGGTTITEAPVTFSFTQLLTLMCEAKSTKWLAL